MYNGYNVEFVEDRFGNPNSAISYGYYQIPPGVYIKGDFTISFWIRNSNDYAKTIFKFENNTYDTILIFSNGFATNWYGVYGDIYSTDWKLVVATLSGRTGSLYINGLLKIQKNEMYIPLNVKRITNIGNIGEAVYQQQNNLNSYLDDLRIYDRALSQSEIYQLLCYPSNSNSTIIKITNMTNTITNLTST